MVSVLNGTLINLLSILNAVHRLREGFCHTLLVTGTLVSHVCAGVPRTNLIKLAFVLDTPVITSLRGQVVGFHSNLFLFLLGSIYPLIFSSYLISVKINLVKNILRQPIWFPSHSIVLQKCMSKVQMSMNTAFLCLQSSKIKLSITTQTKKN